MPAFPSADWEDFSEDLVLGHGAETAARVGRALLDGQIHRRAGVEVSGPGGSPSFIPGAGAVLRFRWFPVPAPVTVGRAEVSDAGVILTYVAAPGHPEEGEETFSVALDDSGAAVFSLRAHSRPARWYSRIGAPLSRAVQRWITRRYLQAVQECARPGAAEES